jgi:phosphonopyruvate decarboxylase
VITADQFLEPARDRGFSFYTGVPCSFLTPLINRVIGHPHLSYVGATSEGEAVAIAAGAWLAGRRSAMMCQNSGLGNAVNPLTSLNHPFRIPSLLIVTWRGQPGLKDEPQHAVMGEITGDLLDVMRLERAAFPSLPEEIDPLLGRIEAEMERTELPFALVMPKGSVSDEGLSQAPQPARPRGEATDLRSAGELPRRIEALERVLALVPDDLAVVATTGKTGRELFTLADREQHLYLVGSMGCASGVGLGIALNCARKVLVLDGDGAALMKMGSLATIGAYAPPNLVHIVLDNGVHDSTGGQATVSPNVDFAATAIACGYASAYSCDSLDGLEQALSAAIRKDRGPSLIHIRIAPGSIEKLGRPTVAPYDVARRFKAFLGGSSRNAHSPGTISAAKEKAGV